MNFNEIITAAEERRYRDVKQLYENMDGKARRELLTNFLDDSDKLHMKIKNVLLGKLIVG